jgi:hypothetical protein
VDEIAARTPGDGVERQKDKEPATTRMDDHGPSIGDQR